MPTPKHGAATVDIAVAPSLVYELVADITRMGEWSPECYRCEWVGEIHQPVVGARFRGHNRMGPIKWSTTCEVVTADPGREFAFTVLFGKDNRESTRWRYRFSPSDRGTALGESFEFVWCPLPTRIGELFLPRGRVLRKGLARTLEHIKAVAEAKLPTGTGDRRNVITSSLTPDLM
jgi:uncharacterized protein YndB with AHSA1/START domain